MQSIQVNSVQLCKYTTTFSNEQYDNAVHCWDSSVCILWHERNGDCTWEKNMYLFIWAEWVRIQQVRMKKLLSVYQHLLPSLSSVCACMCETNIWTSPSTDICVWAGDFLFFLIRPVFPDRHDWVGFIWSWLTENGLLILRETDETTMTSPENFGNQI